LQKGGEAGVRKYMRSMARANMRKAGFAKVNKKRRDLDGSRIKSVFGLNWRDYVNGIPGKPLRRQRKARAG